MSGYVDLHCHFIPNVDDGVRSLEEGVEVLKGLVALGFERVIATPHIRSGMFDNRAPGLRAAYRAFLEASPFGGAGSATPETGLQTGLGAEHHFDDLFWQLLSAGETLAYPGGHAILVEFAYEVWPARVEQRFFDLERHGVRPVLAHPERYAALFHQSDRLDPLLDAGVAALLDLMSLDGRYGKRPMRAAERLLEEGAYYAACSDIHRPADLERVERAIARLKALVGRDEAAELLGENPRRILAGTAEP